MVKQQWNALQGTCYNTKCIGRRSVHALHIRIMFISLNKSNESKNNMTLWRTHFEITYYNVPTYLLYLCVCSHIYGYVRKSGKFIFVFFCNNNGLRILLETLKNTIDIYTKTIHILVLWNIFLIPYAYVSTYIRVDNGT